MRSTLLAASLGNTWALLEDSGYNPENLFQEMGMDPDVLNRAEARVDLYRAIQLWERVGALFNDPCLGLKLTQYWHPSNLHALGYAWISSKTLREALDRLVRYAKILTEGLAFHLVGDEDRVTVTVEFLFDHSRAFDQFIATTKLANLVSMCRLNYRQTLNPVNVTFKRKKPPCSGEYFAFFKSAVYFEKDQNSVTFAKEILDKSLVGHNPQLAKYADQVVMRYLAEHNKSDITERVKVKIVELMPSGEVTAKNIAEKLYLSNRSLNRRLNEAGTSFRELLNQTRLEMASQYLDDANVDLVEIPYLLGYKSYSSFYRAYKRWTGRSPSATAH